jgi:hypothetical protein
MRHSVKHPLGQKHHCENLTNASAFLRRGVMNVVRRRLRAVSAVAVAFLAMTGCGGKLGVVPVSGTVSVNGKPAENIAVSFTPIPGQSTPGSTSSGITDAEGRFELSTVGEHRAAGAVPGKHHVTLNPKITGLDQLSYEEGSKKVARANAAFPPNTRDGSLTFEVPANGTNHADFQFTSTNKH